MKIMFYLKKKLLLLSLFNNNYLLTKIIQLLLFKTTISMKIMTKKKKNMCHKPSKKINKSRTQTQKMGSILNRIRIMEMKRRNMFLKLLRSNQLSTSNQLNNRLIINKNSQMRFCKFRKLNKNISIQVHNLFKNKKLKNKNMNKNWTSLSNQKMH